VNLVAAEWLPYALPLRAPWRTSRGTLHERTGRLLRLQTSDGLTGWGDCAPLPEFGIGEAAAEAFAEECALLDLAARRAGCSLAEWLGGRPPPAGIAVNAAGGPIFATTAEHLAGLAAEGFSVIKLKAGIAPLADEIAALRTLCASLPPGVRLRLDANGAWSPDEAAAFVAASADLPVEGLEEPLREPDAAGLRTLQERTPFPLAIDESVQLLDAAFWHAPPVRRVILKPARQGGLLAAVETALKANASGVEFVVSSALESACGLHALGQLAAAVAPGACHGLATGALFVRDTGAPPAVAGGQLLLPGGPGIGFS
jgi:L-alanine-DL-glutamate epimerase-like enolase superfamily enzyme